MKIAMFTDIHWGAKGNSPQHNDDCSDYIQWFIENVKREKCNAIVFMGDWFENRNSLNVHTVNKSFDGLASLSKLDMPIFFCIGNHDLYHRANRDLYSPYHFKNFKNVTIVNDILHDGNFLFSPYLFKDEYPILASLIEKKKPKYVFGHFEFRNFIVTGSDRKMDHGPEHKYFSGPKYIFSGHFHKRQALDNVVYIGNTFPTNYGDIWDDSRGMAVLDTSSDEVYFLDWANCPKYRKIKLSSLLKDPSLNFPEKCRVRCVIDVDIGYSEAQGIREEMIKQLNLREFSLEENILEKKDAIAGDDESFTDLDSSSINDAVIKMLETGITNTSTIDNKKLVEIYNLL